jgi:phosphohistidine phosphatase SixA
VSTVYLVRHADAGDREKWTDPDHLRPLTKAGRRQVDALTEALAKERVTRVLTSPHVRCVQTVQPLAERLGISIELSDALIEGAATEESVALIEKLAGENAVLCTHGDVVGNLLFYAERHGVPIGEPRMKKASTWVIDTEAGAIISARYTPPPA